MQYVLNGLPTATALQLKAHQNNLQHTYKVKKKKIKQKGIRKKRLDIIRDDQINQDLKKVL